MSDAPFFEPMPDPEDAFDEEEQVVDLPWMPPAHVVGVVAPLSTEVFRTGDVAVMVTHAVCYVRGLELQVSARVRPGSQPRRTPLQPYVGNDDPRVGFRLADGTRLGHRHPHAPMESEDEDAAPAESVVSLTQTSGGAESLSASSSWWLHPFPVGESLDVVVEWGSFGVPESSVRIPLAPLREAAEREVVLWDPPPPAGDGYYGWSAYAPMSGSVYRSRLTIDPETVHEIPGGEPEPS